jgi:hypothetical protein
MLKEPLTSESLKTIDLKTSVFLGPWTRTRNISTEVGGALREESLALASPINVNLGPSLWKMNYYEAERHLLAHRCPWIRHLYHSPSLPPHLSQHNHSPPPSPPPRNTANCCCRNTITAITNLLIHYPLPLVLLPWRRRHSRATALAVVADEEVVGWRVCGDVQRSRRTYM